MAEKEYPSYVDPEYMKDGGLVKKIETANDAMIVLASEMLCNGLYCAMCPVRMYEKKKGGGCVSLRKIAADFVGIENNSDCKVKFLFEHIPELNGKKLPVQLEQHDPEKSCQGCSRMTEIGHCFFCTGWHNFTVLDGYCHLFSAKIEE